MKRRQLIRSMAALPALAGAPAAPQTSLPSAAGRTASSTIAALTETGAEAVANPSTSFLTASQLATLRRLGEIVMPAAEGRPGAVEAGAPEFLDFLLAQSPAARQSLYREGLDRLEAEAKRLHGQPFAGLDRAQAQPILAPLAAAWTYDEPGDSFARFLRAAKDDLLQATFNSREYAAAASRTRRGAAAVNSYWLPFD